MLEQVKKLLGFSPFYLSLLLSVWTWESPWLPSHKNMLMKRLNLRELRRTTITKISQQLQNSTRPKIKNHDVLSTIHEIIICYEQDQYSKVDGSGLGTCKLFWKRNSAKLSTGSSGKSVKILTIPSDRIGTRLTSKYLLKAREVLSKIYLYSFCSFSFFIMQSSC